MATNSQISVGGKASKPPNIECDVEKTVKKDWNCCQLKQYCSKVTELNGLARDDKLKDIRGTKKYAANRLAGNAAAEDFRADWNSDSAMRKSPTKAKFYHECAVKKSKVGPEMQPDHVHEIQRDGHPTALTNLKWLDTSVNRSIQGSVGALPSDVSYVKADCCPAGKAYCKGKGDRAQIV